MNEIMMQLGSFQFGIQTAAYETLRRSTEYQWAEQKRFGKLDALQYVGPGQDKITLSGTVYPEFNGGTKQLEDMRAMAAQGRPLLMVSGLGDLMGRWVILAVGDTGSIFAQAGVARKQEFELELRLFSV